MGLVAVKLYTFGELLAKAIQPVLNPSVGAVCQLRNGILDSIRNTMTHEEEKNIFEEKMGFLITLLTGLPCLVFQNPILDTRISVCLFVLCFWYCHAQGTPSPPGF